MSLNWREISLILSELPLEGSTIQKVTQNTFHAVTWDLYRPDSGRWSLYTEIGTPHSRLHAVTSPVAPPQRQKTPKLQRFIQFSRANLEGAKITQAFQFPGERLVRLLLDNHGRVLKLYFRLYSGAQANIIVTDDKDMILDLLMRRPNRDETSGKQLVLPSIREETDLVNDKFHIRVRTNDSFNQQIEQEYGIESSEMTVEQLKARVEQLRDRELRRLEATVRSLARKRDENVNYETYRETGDLLSSSIHLIKPHSEWVTVPQWAKDGDAATIALDPKLSPSENVAAYYGRYQKAKGTWENACVEYENAVRHLEQTKEKFEQALSDSGDVAKDISRLQRVLQQNAPVQETEKNRTPGLTCTSGQFTLLVGRNAKENDELLRHHTRGNDYWMHTRDCPGGYVFIKYLKDKSVPLDVLLDAANLALVFSKAKSAGKADLYYTQVKHLRRAKDGKTGLVLPTQEKNLAIQLDEKRLARLLSGEDDATTKP